MIPLERTALSSAETTAAPCSGDVQLDDDVDDCSAACDAETIDEVLRRVVIVRTVSGGGAGGGVRPTRGMLRADPRPAPEWVGVVMGRLGVDRAAEPLVTVEDVFPVGGCEW